MRKYEEAISGAGGRPDAGSGEEAACEPAAGIPFTLSRIAGTVYRDESGDGLYDCREDIPVPEAVVSAWDDDRLVEACRTDETGRYSLPVPAGKNYVLKVWRPSPDECYDPRLRLWGFFNTVEGRRETVHSSVRDQDIPVRYRMLNYGPRDFSWELWHRGPVFDRENIVLVHGFRFPAASRRGRCDKQFGRLDDLLQTREDHYNVWQFEYADRVRGTSDEVARYAARLDEALNAVGRLTGRTSCTVIAYSMGGIIARKCIADGAAGKIDRLLTIATPHMGTMRFELFRPRWFDRIVPGVGAELRPDSRLLWDLNTNAELSTAAEFAAIGGYAWGSTDGLIEISSAGLVRCNPDGSVAHKYCFAGVKRSHRNINRVTDKNDQVFRLVRDFLRGGTASMGSSVGPAKRRASSILTFSLKDGLGCKVIYPYVYVENTRRYYWRFRICSQGARVNDGSCIFSVRLKPDDDGEVRIYYARGKYGTVRVRSGQSTIVTQPIGAGAARLGVKSLAPV